MDDPFTAFQNSNHAGRSKQPQSGAEGKAAIEWFHGIGRLDGDGNVDFRACVSGSPRTPWFFSRHTGFEIVSRKGKVDKGQIVA